MADDVASIFKGKIIDPVIVIDRVSRLDSVVVYAELIDSVGQSVMITLSGIVFVCISLLSH